MSGGLFPMLVPSCHQLPPWFGLRQPRGAPGRVLNAVAWEASARLTATFCYDRQINEFRRELGLPPSRANALLGGLDVARVLLLTSPHYHPIPPDWADRYAVTGFTIWDGPAGHQLPDDIASFLAAGEPPVLVTLGSSASSSLHELFEVVADGLDRLGLRGLFLVGADSNIRGSLASRSDVWSFASLVPLLRHCRAVVHSGAHGTSASARVRGSPGGVRQSPGRGDCGTMRSVPSNVVHHVRNIGDKFRLGAMATYTEMWPDEPRPEWFR